MEHPVALNPGKKEHFTLVEKTSVSHDTTKLRFALQSPQHILGLPVGKHMYVSYQEGATPFNWIPGLVCAAAVGYATMQTYNTSTSIISAVSVIVVLSLLGVGKGNPGEEVKRPYTPTSSNNDIGIFDLVIKVYRPCERFPDGGKMSQYLDALSVGDLLAVRGPVGNITYSEPGTFVKQLPSAEPEVRRATRVGMLAGGTGITPMLQVARAILENPDDNTTVSLIFANKTEDDILVRDLLEEYAAKYPSQFSLFYTLDDPPEGWKYGRGFISVDMIRSHLPGAGDDVQILMCGPPPMIKFACIANLKKLNFDSSMWLKF